MQNDYKKKSIGPKHDKILVFILWLIMFLVPILGIKHFFKATFQIEKEAFAIKINEELKKVFLDLKDFSKPDVFFKTTLFYEDINNSLKTLKSKSVLSNAYYRTPLISSLNGKINNYSFLNLKKEFGKLSSVSPDSLFLMTNNPDNQFYYYASPSMQILDNKSMKRELHKGFQILLKKFNTKGAMPREVFKLSESPGLFKSLGLARGLFSYPVRQINRFSFNAKAISTFFVFPVIYSKRVAAFVVAALDSKKIDKKFLENYLVEYAKKFNVKLTLSKWEKNIEQIKNNKNPQAYVTKSFPSIFFEGNKRAFLSKKIIYPSLSFLKLHSLIQGLLTLLIGLSLLALLARLLGRVQQNQQSIEKQIKGYISLLAIIPIFLLFSIGLKQLKYDKEMYQQKKTEELNKFVSELENRFQQTRNNYLLETNIISIMFEETGLEDLSKIAASALNKVFTTTSYKLYNNLIAVSKTPKSLFFHSTVSDQAVEKLKVPLKNIFKQTLLDMGCLSNLNLAQKNKIEQQTGLSKELLGQIFDLHELNRLFIQVGQMVANPVSTSKARSIIHFLDVNNDKQPDSLIGFFSSLGRSYYYFNKHLIDNYPSGLGSNISFQINRTTGGKVQNQRGDVLYKRFNLMLQKKLSPNTLEKLLSLEGNKKEIIEEKENILVSISRVIGEKELLITAFTNIPPQNIFEKTSTIAFLSALFIFLATIILCNITFKALLLPLPVFTKAISRMEDEDFFWHINVKSGDEFSELAKSFNNLALSLKEKQAMSQLVSEDVIELVESSEVEVETGQSKRGLATILFADIRNFTTLTEEHSPEEIVEMLNDYFTVMIRVIKSNGGRIDKLVGDAIQAVFYQKQEHENSVVIAVKAAIEMQTQLKSFNIKRKEESKFQIENGVGISYGEVVTGVTGSKSGQIDSTILGRPIKAAQQIESLTKICHDSNILIDFNAQQKLENNFVYKEFKPPVQTNISETLFAILGESTVNE